MNKLEDLFVVVFAGILAAVFAFVVGVCIMASIDATIENPQNFGICFAVCGTFLVGLAPCYIIFTESIKYNLEKIW